MASAPIEKEKVSNQFEWNVVSKSIIRTLLYFNIFHYPLSKEELLKYCSSAIGSETFDRELNRLLLHRYIFSLNGFFALQTKFDLSDKRMIGNIRAQKMLNKAMIHTKWMSVLPFVECVCISGSLSKLYADDFSDTDYFIITRPNRLWIFRTIIGVVVKMLKLFGKHKYLCPNFVISSDKLTIENKTIFSAMEVVTLIPIYGKAEYYKFIDHNQWVKSYFPADSTPRLEYMITRSNTHCKTIIKSVE